MLRNQSAILAAELRKEETSLLRLALHMQNLGEKLDWPVPESWSAPASDQFVVEDGSLRFLSLAARNSVIAEALVDRHFTGTNLDFDLLLSTAFGLWEKEIMVEDMASGRLLAAVNERVDLLPLFIKHLGHEAGSYEKDLIAVMFPFASSLNLDSVISYIRALCTVEPESFRHDRFVWAFDRWLRSRRQAAHDLYQRSHDPAEAVDNLLIRMAIASLQVSALDDAVSLARTSFHSTSEDHKRIGLEAFGNFLQITGLNAEQRSELEGLILTSCGTESTQAVRAAAIDAATWCLHHVPAFDDFMTQLCVAGDSAALRGVTRSLFQPSTDFQPKERFFEFLPLIAVIAPVEALRLDFVLSKIVAGSDQERVLDFLRTWILKQNREVLREAPFANTFPLCVEKLAGQPEHFSQLITRWLVDDDRRLTEAVAGMIQNLSVQMGREQSRSGGSKLLKLDPHRIAALQTSERALIVSRILGFFHEPKILLSLLLSLLDVEADALTEVIPLARWAIVEQVGVDHCDTTLNTLKDHRAAETDTRVIEALESWSDELTRWIAPLRALADRDELKPSRGLIHKFALAKHKQMVKVFEEASKQSILRSIASQIHMKAGRRCFSYYGGKFSAPNELKTISHTAELPARSVLDPVGSELRQLHMRSATKSKQ